MNHTDRSSSLVRGLGLLDATMIVIGSMIGSGIFIVSAESSRLIGAPGWLLLTWVVAGLLTITGALCCAELATMMPRAGGVYVFLREAYGPALGFLFGWTLFLVVQTGTIAAVAIAFARFLGVFAPGVAGDHYLIAPIVLLPGVCHQSFDRTTGRDPFDCASHIFEHSRTSRRQDCPKQFYLHKNRRAHRRDHYWTHFWMETKLRSAGIALVGCGR